MEEPQEEATSKSPEESPSLEEEESSSKLPADAGIEQSSEAGAGTANDPQPVHEEHAPAPEETATENEAKETIDSVAGAIDAQVGHQQQESPEPKGSGTEVQDLEFQDLDPGPDGMGDDPKNLDRLMDVDLVLTAELGRANILLRDVLKLHPGSVVELDREAGEVIDVLVNNHIIAKGEVVVVDDRFGVRISELIPVRTS